MVNINELRIGNYLLHKNFGIVKISGFNDYVIQYEYEDATYCDDVEDFNCIELTEEILFKCGSIKKKHLVFNSLHEINIKRNIKLAFSDIGTPNFILYIKQDNDTISVYNFDYDKYMYIHQLQNLYFILTKRELEINL